jgi:hypothetical protein
MEVQQKSNQFRGNHEGTARTKEGRCYPQIAQIAQIGRGENSPASSAARIQKSVKSAQSVDRSLLGAFVIRSTPAFSAARLLEFASILR